MQSLWNLFARFVSRPAVVSWLIRRAARTPYVHITGPSGTVYMYRFWLFNPYPSSDVKQAAIDAGEKEPQNWFPISIRLHHIMRKDDDRHMHDHPWNARTIILDGSYVEVRPGNESLATAIVRHPGDTASLKFGEYHRITHVSPGGVWTLFITGKYRGTWGFNVDGKKIQWRTYLGLDKAA